MDTPQHPTDAIQRGFMLTATEEEARRRIAMGQLPFITVSATDEQKKDGQILVSFDWPGEPQSDAIIARAESLVDEVREVFDELLAEYDGQLNTPELRREIISKLLARPCKVC